MSAGVKSTELKYWKFNMDQTQFGETHGWSMPDYDDSRWTQVEAYTSWETYEYALNDYEGCGWFRTWVEVGSKAGKRIVLKFDGVGGVAKVFFNGKWVCTNEDRYLPFEVDVTDQANKGRNLVAVLVDNSFRGNDHLTGGRRIEWVLYGGLTHRIYLEEQPLCYICHIRADARADGSLKVTVDVENRESRVTVPDFAGEVSVCVEGLPELADSRKVQLRAKEKLQLIFTCQAKDVKTWSPDSPNLYNLKVVLKQEGQEHYSVTERIGFRTIEVRGVDILLNGEKIYLKGANRYDEYAPYGICPPEERIREELLQMKQCGMNIVRTHYPQDELHYRLADELGIMYMIEVPLNWWNPVENSVFADFCGLIKEAVDNLDRTFHCFCNHPCWTVWSVGNECSHSHPAVNQAFRLLAERMRSYEPGRLISYAANKPLLNSTELDFVDFLGMNYYSGAWVEQASQLPEKLNADLNGKLKKALELYPDKPHVMTEYGYPCVYGVHGSMTEGRFTEDFGSNFLQQTLDEQANDPNMKGRIIWCWADYRHRRGYVPDKTSMGIQATYGPYGLVSMDRKPKQLLLDVIKNFYTNWNPEN